MSTDIMSSRCPLCTDNCDAVIRCYGSGETLGCNVCTTTMSQAEYWQHKAKKLGIPVSDIPSDEGIPTICPNCGEPITCYDVDVVVGADGRIVACSDCTYTQDIHEYALEQAELYGEEAPWGEDLGPCKYDEGVA